MADGIWLEVSRVRIEVDKVTVQVKADADDAENWWTVEGSALSTSDDSQTYNTIATALDNSERVVIAKLSPNSPSSLSCSAIRIQTK